MITTDLIELIEQNTGLKCVPLHTDSLNDCIVYTEQVLADDGAKAKHRLELRIISQTYKNAEIYRDALINCLVNIGDEIKIDNILEGNINGGGVLYDYGTQTIHNIQYFEFITKSGVTE